MIIHVTAQRPKPSSNIFLSFSEKKPQCDQNLFHEMLVLSANQATHNKYGKEMLFYKKGKITIETHNK